MDRKKTLIKELNRFSQAISKDYPLQKMILFGSQITGRATESSDVDLILVSEKFKKKRWLKRSPPLYLKWHLNYPVDFLCYTPAEFERLRKRVSLVREAVEKGMNGIKGEKREKGALLFSPGFASFGMFKNEYDRNDQFVRLVSELS